MQIDPRIPGNAPPPPPTNRGEGVRTVSQGSASVGDTSSRNDSQFLSFPELLSLVKAAVATAETPSAHFESAAQNLKSGAYDSPQVAEQTAAKILGR